MRTITSNLAPAAAALALAASLVACGGGSVNLRDDIAVHRANGARVAVVSLNVNNYGGSMTTASFRDVSGFITQSMNRMLQETEAALGEQFTLVPAASFTGAPEYQALSIGGRYEGTFVPMPRPTDLDMANFSRERGELIRAIVPAQKLAALAAALKLDLLVVVYSEWATKTGSFVPTSKALTKNVLGIYDATGRPLYRHRRDVVGAKTLGAFNIMNINEGSIDQWVDAYVVAMRAMLDATR